MASEGPNTMDNVSEQCDLCDESTLFQCSECRIKLCRCCANEHHLQETTHDIQSYVTDKSETKSTSVPCRIHMDRKCELYCQDCEIPVCQDCITTGHHGYHDLKNAQDLIHEKRKAINHDTKEMESILETELMNIQKRLDVLASTSPSKYEDLEEVIIQHGLRERLRSKKDLVVAEGYVFEFERRGYLRAGCFVPEVVLNHPDLVRSLYEEFVHAGSDVVLAFTYYGHREKLKVIGRDQEVRELNLRALKLAKEVAVKTGTLMAGNICNSTVFQRGNESTIEAARAMFKEQIEWAVESGADYIVAETFSDYAEAELALQCIKVYGNGLPAVVSFIAHSNDTTADGLSFPKACRRLEEAGADVVGLNCGRGPKTMMPLIKEIRKVCKGPICMLPVPYRTTPEQPTMQSLINPETGKQAFPFDLPAFACSRTQIAEFAREAKQVGVQYIGVCCGNASHYIRVVAEEYGRRPPASQFSPNMSEHFVFGDKEHVKDYHATTLLPNM